MIECFKEHCGMSYDEFLNHMNRNNLWNIFNSDGDVEPILDFSDESIEESLYALQGDLSSEKMHLIYLSYCRKYKDIPIYRKYLEEIGEL